MHSRQKMIVAAIAAIAMGMSPGLHAGNRQAMPGQATVHVDAHGPGNRTGGQGLMAACDPFSISWSDERTNDDVPDDSDDSTFRAGTGPARRIGAVRAIAGVPDAAVQVIGRTPAEIDRNFIGVITRNFENGGTASRVARLSDRELAAIARHAKGGAASELARLLKVFATRLDAQSLARISSAFGRAPVEGAVRAYASPTVRADFERRVAGLMAGGEGGGGAGPAPTLDMTLEEIYLEFRTAPVGSLTPAASLASTAMYAGTMPYGSYRGGEWVGSQIHALIQTYAPEVDDTIGGTIGQMIDNFWEATSEFQIGHFESAFDSLFGFPLTWSSDPSGDWDVSAPMLFYYQSASTCGW
jgi:hypothetical protein